MSEVVSIFGPKKQKRQVRALTELNLKWLREKVLKGQEIKAEVEKGKYSIDSKELANRLLNKK